MNLDELAWNRVRYTLYSVFYDRIVRLGQARGRAISLLALRPGDRVLVVGAGTGQDLDHLPAGVEVVAGDVAPGMLRRLRRRARNAPMAVEVRELDASSLDLADEEFDAILLHLVLAVVSDPQACMSEAARVLRPRGHISVLDKFSPEGEDVSLWRRALNPVARILATSIDRKLEPLIADLPLVLELRESAGFGGLLEIGLLRKEGSRR